MHYLMFALAEKDPGVSTPLEARAYIMDTLLDSGFCNQGIFSNGPADYFVIGGRWTGFLSRLFLDQEKLKEYDNRKKAIYRQSLTFEREIDRLDAIEKIFLELFPDWDIDELVIPDSEIRGTMNRYGEDDDVMILSKPIYDFLVSHCEPYSHEYIYTKMCYLDLETLGPISPTDIGRKWVAVIDFHN